MAIAKMYRFRHALTVLALIGMLGFFGYEAYRSDHTTVAQTPATTGQR